MIKVETRKAVWGKSSLTSPEALENCIAHYDFLPFFSNKVKGWSIEEMTPHSLWFTETPGPWEWKGPVARQGSFLYGKFFNKKAGYVDRTVFARFAQVRRVLPAARQPMAAAREAWLMDRMSLGEAVLSPELKEAWCEEFGSAAGLDATLTALQMRTELVICDFEYKKTKQGEPYGWGLARYVRPEFFIGEDFLNEGADTPEEALESLTTELSAKLPQADPLVLRTILAGRR